MNLQENRIGKISLYLTKEISSDSILLAIKRSDRGGDSKSNIFFRELKIYERIIFRGDLAYPKAKSAGTIG